MIPSQFDYIKATSVAHAIDLLNEHGDEAKLLSGGHSLVPTMKLRFNSPGVLIDVGGLAELNAISEQGDHIHVGANCTHAEILNSDLVQNHVSILAQTAKGIGDIQVRNRGTIGGSLAHADPAADYPATVLACDAVIEVEGKRGRRNIAATDFFKGIFTTALEEDELITGVRFPKTPQGNYQKFFQSASRFAVVGVAVVKDNGKVRVGVTGVSGTPYRATAVEEAYTGNSNVAEHAVDGIDDIMSDHFADVSYRSHLAKIFVKRALEA